MDAVNDDKLVNLDEVLHNHQQAIMRLEAAMEAIVDRIAAQSVKIETIFLMAQAAASRIPPNA